MNIEAFNIPGVFTEKILNKTTVSMGNKMTTQASSFANKLNHLLKPESLESSSPYIQKSLLRLKSLDDKYNHMIRIGHDHEHNYCSLCGSMIESDGSCPLCIVPTILCGNSVAENQAIQNQAISQVNSLPCKMGGLTLRSSKK